MPFNVKNAEGFLWKFLTMYALVSTLQCKCGGWSTQSKHQPACDLAWWLCLHVWLDIKWRIVSDFKLWPKRWVVMHLVLCTR